MVLFFDNGNLNSIIQLPCLGDNKLTGQIPLEVGWLTEMKIFNMSHNMLSDEIPTEVGRMNVLLELDLSEYFIHINSIWDLH